ncbi:MAG: hypothetical protein R2788_16150 [Saprospiraceae bacterium]
MQDIIATVRRFKEGDHKARIAKASDKDLAMLTTFNDMKPIRSKRILKN